MSLLRLSRGVRFRLTFVGLCVSAAIARPASAQNLTYTLSGVTFSDGAAATGYFVFNPAAQSFGDFRITTTDGTTGSQTGGTYAAPETSPFKSGSVYFEFDNFAALRTLGLATSTEASSPGVVALALSNTSFVSQEITGNSTRDITAGFLDITAPAAVPEASSAVSLGLLLVLGAGSIISARRRKSAPNANLHQI